METKMRTTLAVEGMTCPSCIAHVNRTLREIDGVQSIDVRMREGTVVVEHGDGANVSMLVEALREAGYPSTPRA